MNTAPIPTSYSPPKHTGRLSDVADAVDFEPTCATRLTILRAPSPPPALHLTTSIPSSRSSFAFPLGRAAPGSGYFSQGSPGGGVISNSIDGSHQLPRVPTRHMSESEMQSHICGLLQDETEDEDSVSMITSPAAGAEPVSIPGAYSPASSLSHSLMSSSSLSVSTAGPTLALAPLRMMPLADDILLPFHERHIEVPELLNAPCNAALKMSLQRLAGGLAWEALERALRKPRELMEDEAWMKDLKTIVGSKDSSTWTMLRGMLGADDLVNTPTTDSPVPIGCHSVRFMSHHEGDPVLHSSSIATSGLGLSGGSVTGFGLVPRRPSMDSVFYSDSGSEATSSSPDFPSPPHPARSFPHQQSPHRYHHHRTSQGGSIASPVMPMAAIVEEPPDAGSGEGTDSRSAMRRTASFGGVVPAGSPPISPTRSPDMGRMLGLTISNLTADEGHSWGHEHGHGRGDNQYGARKVRYSFGEVDAKGMGLGLHTAGKDRR